MPILSANDPRLGPPRDFESPFPSRDAGSSRLFGALIREVQTLPGAPPEGIMAARQAQAWSTANAHLMRTRFTAPAAGGLRSDWLPTVMSVAPANGLQEVRGLFANVAFPQSMDGKAMGAAALDVGLSAAQNAISAAPIVGNVIRAAIGFGRMIWTLLSSRKDGEAPPQVPWEAFSRETDTDVVNGPLAALMGATDWTSFFAPALDYKAGFKIRKTKKGGETRAYGVFLPSGAPNFMGGFGFMPGTERMTQVIQVAMISKGPTHRLDSVTDVGSFLPSSAQFGTGAWSQVNKAGNPDMYKVRAGELLDRWESYFDAFFGNAFDRWGSVDDLSQLFMAKALSKFIYSAKAPGWPHVALSLDKFSHPFISPDIFNADKFKNPQQPSAVYDRIDTLYVLPALRALKQRQKSMLARSIVCALVRTEEVGGKPRFSAFDDQSAPLSPGHATFGEELADYCKQMRELLLKHPARFELAHPKPGSMALQQHAPDVRDVDPTYADRLEATFGDGGWLKMPSKRGLAVAPLEPDAPKPDGAPSPGGGPPFPPPPDDTTRKTLSWLMTALAGTAVAAGVGGALYLTRKDR